MGQIIGGCGSQTQISQATVPVPAIKTEVPVYNSAVSLRSLVALSEEIVKAEFAGVKDFTTADVVEKVVVPRTKERQCRFTEILPPEDVGPPVVFVSHRWRDSFLALVASLKQHLRYDRDPAAGDATVWLDIFAVNQHSDVKRAHDLEDLGTAVKTAQRTCLHLDAQGLVLTRIWCLYEIWKTAMDDVKKLEIMGYSLHFGQLREIFYAVDVEQAQATVEDDRVRILADISTTIGFSDLNKALKQALLDSTNLKLSRARMLKEEEPVEYEQALVDDAEMDAQQGQFADSEAKYREAIAISERELGPENLEVATWQNNLAELLKRVGRLGEAEELLRRSMAIHDKHWGPGHPSSASSVSGLAGILRLQGRLAEAEPLYKSAISMAEQSLGPRHPSLGSLINNLAQVKLSLGQYGEAQDLFRRSLSILEETRGSNHPLVAVTLSNLATALKYDGKLEEAVPYAERAVKVGEVVLGENAVEVGSLLNNLAAIYQDMQRLPEAEAGYRRSLAILESTLGPDHPNTVGTANNLAQTLQDQGKLSEAEPLMQRSLDQAIAQLGPMHPDVAIYMNNMAMLLQDEGKLNEAQALLVKSVEIGVAELGTEHPLVKARMQNLENLKKLIAAEGK